MPHLDEDRLFRFVLGQLSQAETELAEAHLAQCEDCKRRQGNLSSIAFSNTLTTPAPATVKDGPSTRPDAPGAKADGGLATGPVGQGKTLGRYVLLERLGAGGMGEVYSAYDPQLDRRVALKLLRAGALSATEGKARLLREAQAMARLQHPNVVAVHDVGTFGEAVFIAMEFVEGETLGEWLRGERPWADVVRLFLQAGTGLAAAHRAGLVHRDFKPDNVLIGTDGRPRVLDFGLARQSTSHPPTPSAGNKVEPVPESVADTPLTARLTRDGAVMGTPGYMAPEQLSGMPTDARCDQFAFCVALYEGLYGKRPYGGATLKQHAQAILENKPTPPPAGSPVPGWMFEVLKRGLSYNPVDRYEDMEALLAKLKPPAAVAKRASLTVGAIATVTVAIAIWAGLAQQKLSVCGGLEKRLTGTWDAPSKQHLKDVVLASGLPFAGDTWHSVETAVDGWTAEWVTTARTTCEAGRVRKSEPEETYQLKSACLDGRLARLNAFTNLLESGDKEVVSRAAHMARSLEPVAGCLDTAQLRPTATLSPAEKQADDAVRAAITEAHTLFDAGKYARGIEVLAKVLGLAATPRTLADASLWLGRLRVRAGDVKAAGADFEQAATFALAAGDGALEATALSRLAANHGYDQELPDADTYARLARAAAKRAPNDWEVEAELSKNEANLSFGRKQYKEALAAYERVLRLQEEHLGPQHAEVAMTLNNLGVTYSMLGDTENAIARYDRAFELHQSLEGPSHPNTASVEHNLAFVLRKQGRYSEAAEHYQHALTVRRDALGPEHPETLKTADGLARVAIQLGRQELAASLLEETLATRQKLNGPDSKEVAQTLELLADLYTAGGYWKEAQRWAEQELGIYRKLGDHGLPLSTALTSLGGIQAHLGLWADAKRSLDEALALRTEKAGPESNEVAVVLNAMADLALAQKRTAEALPLYVKAMELRAKAGTATPEARASDLLGQGRALVLLGRPAEAVAPLERALEETKGVEEAHVVTSSKFELARARWLSDEARRSEAAVQLAGLWPELRGEERRDAEAWLTKNGLLAAPDAGAPAP